MLESAWLFIGVVATVVTFGCVMTPDDGWAILLGVVGFLSWGAFAYGGFDITVVGDSVTYSFANPAVSFWGLIMSLIPGYIALTGPADIITNYSRVDADDL